MSLRRCHWRYLRPTSAAPPNIIRYDAEGGPLNDESTKKSGAGYRWWNPVRYLSKLCSFVYLCVAGDDGLPFPLTLEECLDLHFDEERLHGANQYRCPKCEKLVDATKRHSLLWAPEVLMIHLKRFEVGAYWTSKRHDPIIFPAGHASTRWRRPLNLSAYEASLRGRSPSYELTGVVNHHGSFGGGHYTAFTHKGAELGWVHCNDASVKRADAADVVDSQEYLLMYRKQRPPIKPDDAEWAMSQTARRYLSSEPSDEVGEGVMVQRSWLHRVATFVEPGPLLNKLCYCGGAKPAQHFHGTAAGAFVNVSREDYEQLAAVHGGPLVDQMPSTTVIQQRLIDEVQWLRRQR
jgi:ubiquitin carboxyl-terminal hydrolase 20/33